MCGYFDDEKIKKSTQISELFTFQMSEADSMVQYREIFSRKLWAFGKAKVWQGCSTGWPSFARYWGKLL
jgi:hypothetical protein